MRVEDSICNAIEIIVNKRLAESNFNKTVTAIIDSKLDSSLGKYKVIYQDMKFDAYAIDKTEDYATGTSVYILIVNNDMSAKKIIIGSTKKI